MVNLGASALCLSAGVVTPPEVGGIGGIGRDGPGQLVVSTSQQVKFSHSSLVEDEATDFEPESQLAECGNHHLTTNHH